MLFTIQECSSPPPVEDWPEFHVCPSVLRQLNRSRPALHLDVPQLLDTPTMAKRKRSFPADDAMTQCAVLYISIVLRETNRARTVNRFHHHDSTEVQRRDCSRENEHAHHIADFGRISFPRVVHWEKRQTVGNMLSSDDEAFLSTIDSVRYAIPGEMWTNGNAFEAPSTQHSYQIH